MINKKKVFGTLVFIAVLLIFGTTLVAQNTTTKSTIDSSEQQKETIKTDPVNLTTLENKLQKAKQTKNPIAIANAYYKYTEFYLNPLDETCLKYCDSIILITKYGEKNDMFPAEGYKQKGRYYYKSGKYNTALNNYLDALDYAREKTLLYETINFNIGLIRNSAKQRVEAKKIFKRYVNFLEVDQKKEPAQNYNLALFALSHSYTYTGQLDSAAYYIDKGMKNCIATKDDFSYSYFVLNSGIKSYFEKDYKTAHDSLMRAKELFFSDSNRRTSLAFAHLYLGKNNLAMNKKGIQHFKSVDSILEITEDVFPELLETYDDLKKYYKSKGDPETGVHYLEQQIKFNDIYTKGYEDLILNIKDYDVEKFLKEKDELIDTINKKNNVIVIVLLSLLLAFAGAIYYFFRKQVIHKKRFHKLLAAQEEKQSKKSTNKNEQVATVENTIKELPEDLVNDILAKLKKFEATDKFAKKKYTLPQLAKELNTNGTYLSKVINETKQVNFANYLNQLRIEYAVARITNDSRFREYTIKAIAEECGFKTQQSFSAAFYKKTGIKPSFFVRQLKNKIKSSIN
ncbi:helix-turn-helix transcriptional regulator [Kordia sp. YSTF-M3]|uniref:Helix-turn-helix transcriptional regulator n=1 Tax=Kordia aestuariivivens TaxID=2759037 RepID=A0ABR7QDA1_9FLAO|nr:AraC family transcriptional regulator [Kordia aestuariivivens]MBC8756541.1 helix-turn-helix transcriptional regulator [Kordia aestuariivivens]